MVESQGDFPFRKLKYFTYLILDVLMHVDYEKSVKYMFAVNKEGREFLHKSIILIQNGYINEGLITYSIEDTE